MTQRPWLFCTLVSAQEPRHLPKWNHRNQAATSPHLPHTFALVQAPSLCKCYWKKGIRYIAVVLSTSQAIFAAEMSALFLSMRLCRRTSGFSTNFQTQTEHPITSHCLRPGNELIKSHLDRWSLEHGVASEWRLPRMSPLNIEPCRLR